MNENGETIEDNYLRNANKLQRLKDLLSSGEVKIIDACDKFILVFSLPQLFVFLTEEYAIGPIFDV